MLASHLDLNKLMRLLHGDAAPDGRVRREDVHAVAAWDWGPMLAAGHIWRELGLEAALDRLTRPGRSDATTLSDRALVLVANRLTAPLRPIYHQTDSAALAFLLHRAIDKKLKAARLDLSATEALTALKSVRVVDINLGDGTAKRSVTTGTNRAAAVLRALGITELEPSTPPQPGETVM